MEPDSGEHKEDRAMVMEGFDKGEDEAGDWWAQSSSFFACPNFVAVKPLISQISVVVEYNGE